MYGWVVSRLVSLNESFAEMNDPLKPDRSKDRDDGVNNIHWKIHITLICKNHSFKYLNIVYLL